MTEKSLTGTLCLNTKKQRKTILPQAYHISGNMDRSSDKRVFYHFAIQAPVKCCSSGILQSFYTFQIVSIILNFFSLQCSWASLLETTYCSAHPFTIQ